MKKYKVKAGKEFVVVSIEIGEDKPGGRWGTVATVGAAAVMTGFAVPAAYGAVTGDFSALQSVAEYVRSIIEAIASVRT